MVVWRAWQVMPFGWISELRHSRVPKPCDIQPASARARFSETENIFRPIVTQNDLMTQMT